MYNVGLFGGLGNQLFQYAMGRALQVRGNEVTFERVNLHTGDGVHQRDLAYYGLDGFNTVVNFGRPVGPSYSDWNNPGQLPFRPEVLTLPQPHTLTGHWQCEKYFADVADTIRQDLTLKNGPSERAQDIATKIRSGPSLSLHVRHGDYLAKEAIDYHGIMSLEYYNAALDMVEQKVGKLNLFVFSDDPAWCRTHFYGEIVEGNSRFEDLWLMSLCNHAIIANSTFSWWGAWLNPDQSRIVVGPKNWFVIQHLDARDIIPERWIKL